MASETLPSAETRAAVAAALNELLGALPEPARRALVLRACRLVDEQRQQERERCAATCRQRAALWRGTLAAESTVASAREEARARGNEALYLADLLSSVAPAEPPASVN
jgi:hypothetical protein